MNRSPAILRGGALLVLGLALTACGVPSVTVPTFTVPTFTVPTFTVPTLTVPTINPPAINPPAIGLTLAIGGGNAPGAGATPMPSIPVTGGPDIAQWIIYGLVALVTIVLVIVMFSRFMHRADRPGENKPDV